ncbi:MAG: exonuclease domain-containing protein [Terriglobales bacterium]|jgi:DNA polymerase-3 subunit epsilon
MTADRHEKESRVDFIAIDVETANPALSSICQIGLASFRDGRLYGSWESLINPEDYFHPINVSIHGIDEGDVQSSPIWTEVYPTVCAALQDSIVVSHTAFDRVSILRACEKDGLPCREFRWLDSAKVVRRAWPIFSKRGYGLANVAAHFGIEYKAHDALEDARCAGEIIIRAMTETGLSVDQWIERARHPIDPFAGAAVTRAGDADGPLHGEVLVFTGSLSMLRREAADAASAAGCEVDAGVTGRTTMLVVGDQDISKLAGYPKSTKHRKAENLIDRGQKIRIIGETDFQRIVGL